MPASTMAAIGRGTFILCVTTLWAAVASGASVIHVPADAPTIQAGIELATDGDTVLVAPGRYFEAIDYLGKTITVESTDGGEATIIDATGLDTSVVRVRSGEGEGTVLRGFTITGGAGQPATMAGLGDVSAMFEKGDASPRRNIAAGVTRQGGGVDIFQSVILIEHCIIRDNHVGFGDLAAGGGVFVYQSLGVVLRHCIIEANAAMLGGGVLVAKGDIQIIDCTFRNNTAGVGGGLNVNNSATASVQESYFEGNAVDLFGQVWDVGGGVSMQPSATAEFVSCHFLNNTSTDAGGGIFVGGDATFVESHFQENIAARGGGIASYGTLVVKSSQFVDNLAVGTGNDMSEAGSGGGIYTFSEVISVTTIMGSTFTGNSAVDTPSRGGGGARLNGVVDIIGCTFDGNFTAAWGGALRFDLDRGSVVTISDSTFTGNTSENGGGAIRVSSFDPSSFPWSPPPAKSTISNCIFMNNAADATSGYGGAVLLGGAQSGTQFFDSMFVGNTAWLGGGAFIYSISTDLLRPHFADCTFIENSAQDAGAINFNIKGHGSVTNGTFSSNSALYGGAITIWSDASTRLDRSSFTGNSATYGGAVFSDSGHSTIHRITECDFTANFAVEDGGALYAYRTRVFFCMFNDNTAGQRGGAVMVDGNSTRFVACDMSGNTAGSDGGAMFVYSNSQPKFRGMVVCANSPNNVTGTFVDEGANHFSDTCFVPNVIYVPGDHSTIQAAINAAMHTDEIIVAPGTYNEAINFNGKRISLRSSHGPQATTIDAAGWGTSAVTVATNEGVGTTLRGFTVTGGDAGSAAGGGIYTSGSLLLIDDCTITGNTAEHGGGIKANNPVHGDPGHVAVTDSRILDNHAVQRGGGIRVFGIMSLTGTRLEGNTATLGAGILVDTSAQVTADDCQFRSNIANFLSGAVGLAAKAHFASAGSVYCGNHQGHIHPVDGSSVTWTDLGGNEFADECPITGDLNADGVVDVSDMLILLAAWGPCPENNACPADLNGDGVIDVSDLLILLANWG